MNVKYLGTTYGGWVVDLDSINDGDVIIGGGVGEDISFEEELMEIKDVNVVAVDPTVKSHMFLESKNNPKVILIKKAIEKEGVDSIIVYKNTNPNYVSESVNDEHSMVGVDSYIADTISIKELINEYNPSVIKLDIEGSEYNVYKECIGVKQICIEFHHHCIDSKKLIDTMYIVNYFISNGYIVIDNRQNYQEVSFLKKD